MSNIGKSDEKYLKRCFEEIISIVHQTIEQLQPKQSNSQSNSLHTNSVLNTGIYSFTLNKNENDQMDILREKIENIINKYQSFMNILFQKYLFDFLNPYHFNEDEKKFTNSFSMDSLYPFESSLRGALASLDAFQAAWDGNILNVKDFIQNYPTFKNKPGLHGTTLLYSAARNNHISLVEYLIEKARCSINAQNLQELDKVLQATNGSYRPNPSAASTPLHGACFHGHLDLVKYLIEHGADYFIRNQAGETPIDNGKRRENIRNFFLHFLLLNYSQKSTYFPKEPIKEKFSADTYDCLWEYKPFNTDKWYLFSSDESLQLNQSLLVENDEDMKQEVYFHINSIISTVSVIKFLRTEESRAHKNNLSWIRCRGSSLWNFDCYSFWQIMIIKHPNIHTNSSSLLKVFDIPKTYDSRFRLQLNCWYNCPIAVNSNIDSAMNYRRKIFRFNVDFLDNDKLTFNLQSFTFENSDKTIFGYIRWLPKLISRNAKSMNKIQFIDNFQNLANLDPVPFTTKRLKLNDKNSSGNEDTLNQDDLTSATHTNIDDEDDDDDNNFHYQAQRNKRLDNDSWSVNDFKKDDDDDTQSIKSDDTSSEILDDYLDEASSTARAVSTFEESHSSVDRQQLIAIKAELEKQNETNQNLEDQLKAANDQMNKYLQDSKEKTQKQREEHENLKKKIQLLNDEQRRLQEEKNHLQNIEKSIKSIDYKNIETKIVQDFLTPKYSLIIDHLKKTKIQFKNYPLDKIIRMSFQQTANTYTVTIVGFEEHHQKFKEILTRLRNLLRLTQSAKDFYQLKLNKMTNNIKRILSKVQPKTQLWKEYLHLFIEVLNDKTDESKDLFNDHIEEKTKKLIDQSILNDINTIRTEIHSQTNNFIQTNSLFNHIETFKQQALEKFIKENIILQRNYQEKKPTAKSISTLQYFIEKIRMTLKTNAKFQGYQLENYNQIPHLLQRLIIYYCSFKIQLPLFESAQDLLNKIEQNTVTTIATSTGSGKSTLLPALLAAEGYDKILVTQPRRLPCTLIAERVNQTMTTLKDSLSLKLAGWAVSGAESNPTGQILYLTDGLLKERLLYDENFIRRDTQLNKSIVFFIDEVHERSVNIDHCLALLARILTIKPELKSQMRLIISSATLDASVPKLYRQIPNIKFSEFEMPQMGTLYTVTKCSRPNENILNLVQELYQQRRRYDQILCFVSSVKEVNECCTLLKKITAGAITAYPLIQSQQASVQQEYIDQGCVFFSTTVAETSLTFPQLKYVIDTGFINIPVYDPESKRTVLKADRAAESTIKQRLGRLGRTQEGTYYSLYDFKVDDKHFPTPQICQSDLMNIEFSLRKSPLKKGFEYMKDFFPDKPPQHILDHTIKELKKLGIVSEVPGESLTNHGFALAKLPDFGSLAMSKCVLAALKEYGCGRDLIILSSMLGVLNTTAVLKPIPQKYKSTDGDFMTLLNVLDDVLLVKQSVAAKDFRLDRICQDKDLKSIQHIIRQALRRYSTLEKAFNLSVEYRIQAQIKSNNWEFIAKSLLTGYSDNLFVSMKELQDRAHLFIRYNGSTDNDIAEIDSQSVLSRTTSKIPPALILARDIRYSTSVRSKAILSFIGDIKPQWVQHTITRQLTLNAEEETRLNTNNIFTSAKAKFSQLTNLSLNNKTITLSGHTGTIFNAELHVRQQMVEDFRFQLENKNPTNTIQYTNLARNLESVMKMPQIFHPMIWRWDNQKQVKIKINPSTSTNTCEVIVTARNSDYKCVRKEFDSFLSWLQSCAVIRQPNSGVSPRVFRNQVRSKYVDIEERISHITDSKRTPIDLYNGAKGAQATRETRMEVVAWIAVCRFGCRLEGGFVRDWVVGNYTSRPASLLANPSAWISYSNSIPYLTKEVVPADLDCHLPTHQYFDIEKFHDELYKYDISCKVFRQDWRYVLLIDENAKTGPFTMDLIEPHVALTHDRIDFDVNNLSLEKDYTHELGMRVDIQQRPYSIEIE
ncbi:unnamed protein product, partial [Adineta steineri]